MTRAVSAQNQLNRAYVQGKVIQANLEHLRVVLLDANADLRDGLAPFSEGFGKYVRSIGEASVRADAVSRTPDSDAASKRAAAGV